MVLGMHVRIRGMINVVLSIMVKSHENEQGDYICLSSRHPNLMQETISKPTNESQREVLSIPCGPPEPGLQLCLCNWQPSTLRK